MPTARATVRSSAGGLPTPCTGPPADTTRPVRCPRHYGADTDLEPADDVVEDVERGSYDALVARFADAADPTLRGEVAVAFANRVQVLGQLGRAEQALEAFDDMVEGHGADAVAAYEKLIASTEHGHGSGMRRQNIGARYSRATVLAALGEDREACGALDELIARFEDDDDPFIHAVVLTAHERRAELLGGDEP
jgi:tetratricopeptide (TPR) repeat protein